MAIEVNLLRKKERKNRSFILLSSIMGLLTVAIVAACVFFAWQQHEAIQSLQYQVDQQEESNQTLLAEIDGSLDQQSIRQHEALIEQVVGLHPKVGVVLDEVSARLPNATVIDQVIYDEKKLDVTVQVRTSEQAVQYLDQLREIEGIDEVLIHSIQALPEENAQLANYSIVIEAGES